MLASIHIPKERNITKTLSILSQQGYARVKYKNEVIRIEDFSKTVLLAKGEFTDEFELVIDRIVVNHSEDFYNRLADSVQIAFFEGKGTKLQNLTVM